MASCNYYTLLGPITTSVTEGVCIMSMPDDSEFACESGHFHYAPSLSGFPTTLIGQDEFSYTSDYSLTFLGSSPTCGSGTHTITQGIAQAHGYWPSWHFRYFRVTDPFGVVTGYCPWQASGAFPNMGLTTSAAVPINGTPLIYGATAYSNGMILTVNTGPPTSGTWTFELMQVPLPKLGASYGITPGPYGPDVVCLIVPHEFNNGTVVEVAPRPRFFTPLFSISSLSCEQFPYYGTASSQTWQELFPAGSPTSASYWGTPGVGDGFAGTDDWFDGIKTFGNGRYYDITTGRCQNRPPRTYYDCVYNPVPGTSSCQVVTGPTPYTSVGSCNAAFPHGCTPPVTYYDCDPTSGICQAVTGPSAYTSLTSCQTAYPNGCIPDPEEYWECHTDTGCIQVAGPTAYTSEEACNLAYPEGCVDPPVVDPPEIPCMVEYAYKAVCAIKEHECNNRLLCKDDNFIKFLKLLSLRSAGFSAADAGYDDIINNIISLINLICECDSVVGKTSNRDI